ncbi:MAG: transcriptional regulator GcvA [Hyphomicrobiales bacterium]
MARQLPPLTALRAFEAAARHLSVSLAAEELRVTPAAVSHQIRQLEDHLGLELFQRNGRNLALTDAGQAGLPWLREAFDKLASAIDAIDALGETGLLTVSVAPSFAAKWLLPRLHEFEKRYPDIDVHVSASISLVDFARDGVDVAIRYGSGHYPDLVVERLLTEYVVPVASPSLLEQGPPIDAPADLAQHALLHDDSPDNDPSCPSWEMWMKAAHVDGVDATRGPRFNQSSLVLEAAVLGRGIALAKATLAAADLASGRLVSPFRTLQQLDFSYFLVAPKAKLNLPKVSYFRDWIREEVAQSRGELEEQLLAPEKGPALPPRVVPLKRAS